MSGATGRRTATTSSRPARTVEPDTLVRRFLGRPLSYEAFFRELGIGGEGDGRGEGLGAGAVMRVQFDTSVIVQCIAGVALASAFAGCHHKPAEGAAVSIAPRLIEEHCWHTVFQTAYSPDTTAARFEQAFR